ncbi:MAG: hypothetical protein AAGG51_27925 [Cyanobacteria bacterium P01_G01_bin.54]
MKSEENMLEDDLEDTLLQKIQAGLLTSDSTSIEIQERYQEKFKIDSQ